MQAWQIAAAVCVLVLGAGFLWVRTSGPDARDLPPASADHAAQRTTAAAESAPGGDRAPLPPTPLPSPAAQPPAGAPPVAGGPPADPPDDAPPRQAAPGAEGPAADDPLAYGTFPAVPADANEQVAKVVAAARARTDAALQTPVAAIPPFDAKAYREDPQAYLSRAVPARVFQSASPAQDVPILRPQGKRFASIAQGESVVLRVRSAPGWPVTFATSDAGLFDNDLTTISVAADENGLAEARYRATAGVIDDVNIQAASPRASGQVQFTVFVRRVPADDDDDDPAGDAADSPRAHAPPLVPRQPHLSHSHPVNKSCISQSATHPLRDRCPMLCPDRRLPPVAFVPAKGVPS